MENQLFQLPILQFYTNRWAIIRTMLFGTKNPHSSAFVKLWGNLIPLLYLLYCVRKNVSRANNRTFCRITQPHRSRWKNLPKTCLFKRVRAVVKDHGNRVWKCGIGYHNDVAPRVRRTRLSGQRLLKELRFCVFIKKTSWQNRVSVLWYFLQVTSVHLQRSYI